MNNYTVTIGEPGIDAMPVEFTAFDDVTAVAWAECLTIKTWHIHRCEDSPTLPTFEFVASSKVGV